MRPVRLYTRALSDCRVGVPNRLTWLLGQAVHADGWQVSLQGDHVGDEVFLFLSGQVQLFHLVAQVRIRMAPFVVPFDDLFERVQAAIVHEGAGLSNVSNRWGLEGTTVFIILRDVIAAQIGIFLIHPDADVVELLVGEVGPGMAGGAVRLAEEQFATSFG